MNHNESNKGKAAKLTGLNSNELDSNVMFFSNEQIRDEWTHFSEGNPEKILINEKTVYAVDQSMNVVITDIKGNILYGNQNIFDLTMYKPEDILGKSTKTFNAQFHPKEFFQEMWDTILSGRIWRGDLKNLRKDGKVIWVRLIITPLLDKSGNPYQFVGLKEDITEKKEMEFRLAQKDKQLSALTNNSYDIIGIINECGKIDYLNPAFERVLGYTSLEAIGIDLADFIINHDVSLALCMINKVIDQPHEPILQQLRFKHKDGSTRWCDVAFSNYLEDEHIKGIVFNLRDFTKQKEATDFINKLANYDYLTGLPNRRHFENALREALKSAKNQNRRMALLYLDLDGFKNINDSLGHEIGDGLLKEVGQRLKGFFENKATIGRLGGDEFSVIVPDIDDYEHLHLLADSLVRSFNLPFYVDGYELSVSSSIGISIYPYAGDDMKTLLKNADIAMYQAKSEGKNHYQLYSPIMNQNGTK